MAEARFRALEEERAAADALAEAALVKTRELEARLAESSALTKELEARLAESSARALAAEDRALRLAGEIESLRPNARSEEAAAAGGDARAEEAQIGRASCWETV